MPSAELAACTRPHVRARHQVVLGLRPDPAEVGRVRRELRGCLTAWRVTGEAADGVLLLVSELVGNAVRHAPGGTPAKKGKPMTTTPIKTAADPGDDEPTPPPDNPDCGGGDGCGRK